MAKHWLTIDRDLRLRRLLKLTSFRLTIEGSRGVLWLIRAATQGVPELVKESVSLIELGSLLVVKVAPKLKSGITKAQDRIDVTFNRIDSILKDLSITLGAMPYGGRFFDDEESAADAAIAAASVDDPITNIREATKGRHIIILGDTGTGKTTTAQYIVVENSISAEVLVRVYDCEGMFKCLPGWQPVGAGENFDAINTAMKEDLDTLSHFFASGQPEAKEPTHIYIGEEFPDITDQCEHSSRWIDRHARRGRKAGRFLILLSQYDQIKAFGLEGKSSLIKNFRIIRLGEFAIAHAKKLKNPALIRWLEQSKSHCLINDSPLQLPSYEEMTRIIGQCRMSLTSVSLQPQSVSQPPVSSLTVNSLQSHNGHSAVLTSEEFGFEKTSENGSRPTEIQALQPMETDLFGVAQNAEIALLEEILSRFQRGDSADKIAKWVKDNFSMGYARSRSLVDSAINLLSCSATEEN